MAVQNYVFDLYNTLIRIRTDEEPLEFWRRVARRYAAAGAVYAPGELKRAYRRAVGEAEAALAAETGYRWPEIALEDVFLRLLRQRGGRAEPGWLAATAQVFRILSRRELALCPGAAELLARLRAQGKQVFLLSNAQGCFTHAELAAVGLSGAFDAVYLSSEHRMKKPQPEFLRLLLAEQGVDPSETVMIGDDPETDMAIAQSCGVRGILVNRFGGVPLKDLPEL